MQEPSSSPNRSKYCCLCGHKGHEADQCHRSNRVTGPLSVHVMSYRCLLKPPHKEQKSAAPCTILASNLGDCSFNFGKDVASTGNTIYSRFRRAVNMDADQLPENDALQNDVNESNLHDTSDRPIEVYDDFSFEMDNDLDNVSSSEYFSSEAAHANSFTSNNTDSELSGAIDLNESEIDANITSVSNAERQIRQLDGQMQTLNELKNKMIFHQFNRNDTCQSTDQNPSETSNDIDMNASEQKDTVTTSTALPDFIPLSSDEPGIYEPTRSPSPVSADSTTHANEKCDATIHLTEQNCKYLLTEKGNQFCRSSEEQFDISVRLEWRRFGNVLIVNGVPNAQRDFHAELKEFFHSNENCQKSLSICNSLPRNRRALIQFVREHVTQLDSPFCNDRHLADVPGSFFSPIEFVSGKSNKTYFNHYLFTSK